MNDVTRPAAPAVEPRFDRTPMFMPDGVAAGLPDPIVYHASARAWRARTVNFAAKRFADRVYVSGLDRAIATAIAADWP